MSLASFFKARTAPYRSATGLQREVGVEETGEGEIAASITRGPTAAANAVLVGGAERAFTTPGRLDLSRLSKLDEDGGSAAFVREYGDVPVERLAQIIDRQVFLAQVNALVGAVFLGAAILLAIWSEVLVAPALLLVALLFLAVAYVALYRGWQISVRRLAPIRDFARTGRFLSLLFGLSSLTGDFS